MSTSSSPLPATSLAAAGLLALACIVSPAAAAPVTFAFTGVVTDDPFGLSSSGAPISGRYTFDSAATDSIADPQTGAFASTGPTFGFHADVDGRGFSVAGLTVTTGNDLATGDSYGAIAFDGGLTLEIFLQDASSLALASDALPLQAPALTDFPVRQFRLFGTDVEFLGSIDTLACVGGCSALTVPEPGSLALTLLSLGLVGGLAHRRQGASLST
jgi:PEP-CTERM motif